MENYFLTLEKVKCEVEKKNWLNYISWSDAWREIKAIHPDATYEKIKNWDTYLFKSWTGGSVECSVTVNWITHTADLAVTDFKNQEIKYENIRSTDIQNTLQRAFAKAIAMHWIWLYVYRWEDFPQEEKIKPLEFDEYMTLIKSEDNIDTLRVFYKQASDSWQFSDSQMEILESECKKRVDRIQNPAKYNTLPPI